MLISIVRCGRMPVDQARAAVGRVAAGGIREARGNFGDAVDDQAIGRSDDLLPAREGRKVRKRTETGDCENISLHDDGSPAKFRLL